MRQSIRIAAISATVAGGAAAVASVYCTSQGAGALAEQCGQIAGTTVAVVASVAAGVVGGVAGLGTLAWGRLKHRF